jgi:hypothetical protein
MLDMTDCRGMTMDCHCEGKEEKTAEKPYDSDMA